jgi:hypothetical protein
LGTTQETNRNISKNSQCHKRMNHELQDLKIMHDIKENLHVTKIQYKSTKFHRTPATSGIGNSGMHINMVHFQGIEDVQL